MSDTIHYTSCPVCGSKELRQVLSATDHTVSHEKYSILECGVCTLRFTQDVPSAATIAPYYKSENYISHTNTSKGLINRLYHYVRGITLTRKRRLLQKATGRKQGRMLDLGSGTGAFVGEMSSHGWNATGLEPDESARAVALNDYKVVLEDIDQFYSLEPGFDAITMWHVLEHVHDLHAYIAQLRKLLTTKGRLFIAVPNYTAIDASVFKENWAAYDVPRHLYHFSPQSMKALVEAHEMRMLAYKPMWYDSFYISLLSSGIRSGHGRTSWFSAIIVGLRSNLRALTDIKRCSSVIYVIGKGE